MAKAKTRSFVAAAVVLLTLGTSAARAGDCGGQKGKVIYDTAFKDEKGGFEETDVAKYGDPALKLTLRKGDQDIVFINTTTDATLGDYCATATMPMPIGEGNLASVGLTLLYKDNQNMLALLVFSDNTVQIERWNNGESDFVYNEETPAIKAAPGSTVSIRAIVENGAITPIVNGVTLPKTQVKAPEGGNKFGLYTGLDKPADKDVTLEFKSLHITSGGP